MNQLRFTIRLTEEDYYDYLLHSTFRQVHSMSISQRIWNTLAWSMLIGIPIFLFIWAIDGIMAGIIFLGLYTSIAMMGLLRGKRISPLAKTILKKRAKKFATSPGNQDYFKPTNYVLSERGIATSRGDDVTLTAWQDISFKEETARQWLLCTDDARVFILPLNQVGSVEELKAMLGKHLSLHAELSSQIAG